MIPGLAALALSGWGLAWQARQELGRVRASSAEQAAGAAAELALARQELADVQDSRAARQAERDRQEERAALRAALDDRPRPDQVRPTRAALAAISSRIAATFSERELDLDRDPPAALAAALRATGLGLDLVRALDELAALRARADDDPGADRVWTVTQRLDADPLRVHVRQALLRRDVAPLTSATTQAGRLSDLPAPTLSLIASGFVALARPQAALRVLEAAQARHPDAYGLLLQQALVVRQLEPRDVQRELALLQTAVALRPQLSEPRRQLIATLGVAGRWGQAVLQAELALERRPRPHALETPLARALIQLRRFDEAERLLQATLEGDPAALAAGGIGPRQLRQTRAVRALLLSRTGRRAAAEPLLRQLLAEDPDQDPLRWRLLECLLAQGKQDAAEQLARETVARYPERATVLARYSRWLPADARSRYVRQAVELDPQSGQAWLALGALHLEQDDLAGAAGAFRRARELAPSAGEPALGLAQVAQARDDLPEARRWIERSLELEPDRAASYLRLAELELAASPASESGFARTCPPALRAIRRALELEPSDPGGQLHALLGRLLVDHDPVRARAALSAAAEREVPQLMVYVTLAELAAQAGDAAEARAAVSLAEAKAAVLGSLPHVSHRLASALGDGDDALRLAQRAVADEPDCALAYDALGEVLARRGDQEAAFEAFGRAVQLGTPNLKTYQTLFLAAYQSGDRTRAEEILERGLLLTNDPHLTHYLAHVKLELGQGSKALNLARHSVEADPDCLSGWNTLAQVAYQEREFVESWRAYEQVLERGPPSPGVMFQLARSAQAAGDLERAAATLRKGAEQGNGHLAHTLAMFLHDHGQPPAEVLRWARRSVALDPACPHGQATLLLALDLNGLTDEANSVLAGAESQPDPVLLSALAWVMCTATDPVRRQPQRALALAERAAEAMPKATQVRALGFAQLRAGALPEALSTLQRVLELSDDDPLVRFGLSLTYHALGQPEAAQAQLAKGNELVAATPFVLPEVKSLQAEARAALARAPTR